MSARAIGAPVSRGASVWRAPLLTLVVTLALLLGLFARDAADMATIWWTSSTYEHCLVILPIVAWLVWQRVPMLAAMRPRPWGLPLVWVAIGAAGWLVGEAAGVAVARHLGLVMMVQGASAALLGRGATVVLAFPLFYLFFLIPFGDALVPPLQTVTARMCMVLLRIFEVPARIDGVFITTPGGWFKVAEACSGAKFLIAMIALGVLVAHLGFRSWGRRAAFLALCVVVPVIANGVRAFSTIWVAQYTGARAASGIDHVIYGWFFFAAVIAAVLALSWRLFDRAADAPPAEIEVVRRQDALQRRALPMVPVALGALAIACAAPAWSALVTARGAVPVAAGAHLPDVPGWTHVAPAPGMAWRPGFAGVDRLLIGQYRDVDGDRVTLAVALYASQGRGRTLVGYGHGAVTPGSAWAWANDLPATPDTRAEMIEAPGPTRRVVVSSYRVGHIVTGSAAKVKLETLRVRLLGGDQRAAALLVSAEEGQGGRRAVDAFLRALGPIAPAIDRFAGQG